MDYKKINKKVSCYGDDGDGDNGDDWTIVCDQGDPGIPLIGKSVFQLQNTVT